MIELHSVSKALGRGALQKVVLSDLSLRIPPRTRILILGQRGSGKTTLLEIISGSRFPTSGWVERKGSICHVGQLVAPGGVLTPRQMVLRLSHLYGVRSEEVARFVEQFGELTGMMDTPLNILPRDIRPRLSYALSFALPFDFYLFDGSISGRNKDRFRERCQAAFDIRSREAGIVLVTANFRIAANFDGIAGILHNKTIRLFPTAVDAVSVFKKLPPPDNKRVFGGLDEADMEEDEEWI